MLFNNNYNHKITIKDKDIYFRAWTTLDEKNYLLATDSIEVIGVKELWEILVRPCLKDNSIILSDIEQKYLLIKIREVSIGSTIELKYTCNNYTNKETLTVCNSINEIEVEIKDVLEFNNSSFSTVTFKDLVLEFDNPITTNLYNKLEGLAINTFEYNLTYLLIHIKSYTYNGVKNETFNFNELRNFIESIPTNYYSFFYDEFIKQKGILKFNIQSTCIHCNKVNQINTEDIPNFLWV